MPYFRWQGVDLQARYHKGTSFARSVHDLDSFLFQRNIALLATRPAMRIAYHNHLSLSTQQRLIKQLSLLMRSGLTICRALETLLAQCAQRSIQELLFALKGDVHDGNSLSQSMCLYPGMFADVVVQMVRVGEESGALGAVLEVASLYLHELEEFRKKIQGVLLLPAITLLFFLGLLIAIIVVIIPHFQTMFVSMKVDLPFSTQVLIAVSECLRSWCGIALLAVVTACYYMSANIVSKRFRDNVVGRVPFFKDVEQGTNIVYFMRAMSFLVASGIPTARAFSIARCVVRNSVMQDSCTHVMRNIEAGYSMQEAIVQAGGLLAREDIIALMSVGQESSDLVSALDSITQIYQDRVHVMLSRCALCVQPLSMLVLGGLVLWVMVSLYMPLFTMASHY